MLNYSDLPSRYHEHKCFGKPAFFSMSKSTISTFNSKLLVYQRVVPMIIHIRRCFSDQPHWFDIVAAFLGFFKAHWAGRHRVAYHQ